MGKRKIAGSKASKKLVAGPPLSELGCMSPDLIDNSIQIQPVATQGYVPPIFGVPIMREGFITGTGLLLHSLLTVTTFC
jgi:hypothetical protein